MHRPPLGQHFLRDAKALRTIVESAELQPTDTALEIGPGKGALTELLVPRVKRLVAVEFDRTLAPKLQERWASHGHVTVVQADILKTDLDPLFPESPVKVLGNLPYSITSPIFEKLLTWPKWETGVFLIQREVGARMQAKAGSRTYGILSLAVQLFAEVESILTVKPGAFVPPPNVTSLIVRLRRRPAPALAERDIPAFFDLAHAAFSHRRKTLANSLSLFAEIPKKNVEQWLQQQGVHGPLRAESLELVEYARLAAPWAIFRREIKLT
jgi:16S rRNA (adenine1518-N6/adenine1519-N6)-dimethyltransferase